MWRYNNSFFVAGKIQGHHFMIIFNYLNGMTYFLIHRSMQLIVVFVKKILTYVKRCIFYIVFYIIILYVFYILHNYIIHILYFNSAERSHYTLNSVKCLKSPKPIHLQKKKKRESLYSTTLWITKSFCIVKKVLSYRQKQRRHLTLELPTSKETENPYNTIAHTSFLFTYFTNNCLSLLKIPLSTKYPTEIINWSF